MVGVIGLNWLTGVVISIHYIMKFSGRLSLFDLLCIVVFVWLVWPLWLFLMASEHLDKVIIWQKSANPEQ